MATIVRNRARLRASGGVPIEPMSRLSRLLRAASRAARFMKRHPLLCAALALVAGLSACASNAAESADPFAADKPVGPVKPAIYEPKRGVYLGAALDTSAISGDAESALTQQMLGFNRLAGRPQALWMHYLQFPNLAGEFGDWTRDANGWISAQTFAKATQNVGGTPVITLEPFAPQSFLDWKPGSKSYEATKTFAQGAGKWGKPLFIRFAHEMNGSWYPWSEWNDLNQNMRRDAGEETGFTPDKYRQMYRNVAQMFRQYAPNAALVWCPNSGLLGGAKRDVFRPYYPGDDVVDWVGLDVYERGWTMPQPGAKLWGGQFAHNLTHDMADDSSTPANESVNFYLLYGEWKRKPIMICETSATLSFRSDLAPDARAQMSRDWRIGYWNPNEYGWLPAVYGTSDAPGMKFLDPIDQKFPMIKAVMWFQIAKREFVPAQKPDGGFKWFENEWADYRIGGGVAQNAVSPYKQQEVDVYRALTKSPYFLSAVAKDNLRVAAK